MNDFDYIIKMCKKEKENEKRERENDIYLNLLLKNLEKFMCNELEKNEDTNIYEIEKKINNMLEEYLAKISTSEVTVENIKYQLSNKMYSSDINLEKIYKNVVEDLNSKKLDIDEIDVNKVSYCINLKKTMENLVKASLKDIRLQRQQIKEIEGLLESFNFQRKAERKTYLNKIKSDDPANVIVFKRMNDLHKKSDYELIQQSIKANLKSSSAELKRDCIQAIVESVKLLDKFGLIEQYTDANNKICENIYMKDFRYSYEEVKQLLDEENLKKLSNEKLIVMSSFWVNRVNKVIKTMNKALYVYTHPELIENEDKEYYISSETKDNVDLKLNCIHKLYFKMFNEISKNIESLDEQELEEILISKTEQRKTIEIKKYVDVLCKKYGKQYKEYFDKIFPNSENSLRHDLNCCNTYENTRFNSYQVKSFIMQSLLLCLLNSDEKRIENFGYIEEEENKKQIIIGVDVKGLNMPFALHMNKQDVIDFLKETQGNTMFPVYKGSKDFILGGDRHLKPKIYVPLTKKCEENIKKYYSHLTPKDRYGNLTKHINYLTNDGKMPEHMMKKVGKRYKYVREYVDLCEIGGKKIDEDKIGER